MLLSTASTMRLVVILVLVICLTRPISGSDGDEDGWLEHLTFALKTFTGKLLKALNKPDNRRNLFCSPLSIHLALAMILPGTDEGSETRKELRKAMSFLGGEYEGDDERTIWEYEELLKHFRQIKCEASEADDDNKTRVDIFTRMITKKGVKPKQSYVDHIKRNFRSKLSSVFDSESKQKVVDEINKWGKSAGFNSPVIEKEFFDEEFSAVLITAINLEAFWLEGLKEGSGHFYDFGDPEEKKDIKILVGGKIRGSKYMEFSKPDDGKPLCLMHPTLFDEMARLSHLRFRALQMELKDDFMFYIFMPLDQAPDGGKTRKSRASRLPSEGKNAHMKALAVLADKLFEYPDYCEGCKEKGSETCGVNSRTYIETVISAMNIFGNKADLLSFPKIEFESELNMMETLKLLGVKRALTKYSEIRNITDDNLRISDFRHRTMIEATEVGIRAAGMTAVKVLPHSALIRNFRVERPFLYAIYYKRIPLFFGQYVEHSSGGRSPKKDE